MSRLDCREEALGTHMNDAMRQRVVPSRLNGVIPGGF